VQTKRLAASFDTSTRPVTHTEAEIFLRKAMCLGVFFLNPQKQPDAKVLMIHIENFINFNTHGFCKWHPIRCYDTPVGNHWAKVLQSRCST